ncbi:hypothetical protein I7X13_14685 [Hymenobacter sp. BT442]|uniref:Uncharacterized protein n=2 Tax=Hymenobacter negativus TaxID=2795026 RepID=A0ABS0Q9F3_9BACT|nr:hypothetical protein [Hymenobacter negativus]
MLSPTLTHQPTAMTNAEENLNTEPNDIAGNRIDGPVGNTATKHTRPGEGVGQPGGPPTSHATPVPVTSEALADAETSMAQGAVDTDGQPQENKAADPAHLVPEGSYGGNFGNSTQGSYHDQDRRENQDSDPNRGEFGAQDLGGTTHGGFGNQNRLADYEPNNTAEDNYYGGPGRPGEQDNAYRSYDGRDARPDRRTEYGFEAGTTTNSMGNGSNPRFNDNGSPKSVDSGFAADYGHTSLRSGDASGQRTGNVAEGEHRNETTDYMPAEGGANEKEGRHDSGTYSTNQPEMANQRGQGYGDRGRNQPNSVPDNNTGSERNGYTQPEANKGDAGQGIGSRGGSYNDAYDDSKAGSTAGSPAKGEQRAEDTAHNYGSAARQENRTGDEDSADHGAPRRNAGRNGEADE